MFEVGKIYHSTLGGRCFKIIHEFEDGLPYMLKYIGYDINDPECVKTISIHGHFYDGNGIPRTLGKEYIPIKKGWINIYSDGFVSNIHLTEEMADVARDHSSKRIDCIEITYKDQPHG